MVKNHTWRIWAKALGQKEGRTNDEADRIALIRTLIVIFYIITNLLDNNYEIIGSLIYPELTLTNIVKTSSNEFIIRKLL